MTEEQIITKQNDDGTWSAELGNFTVDFMPTEEKAIKFIERLIKKAQDRGI